MRLFVLTDEMPQSCSVCRFHVGVDGCFLCPRKAGEFFNKRGGADGCPLEYVTSVGGIDITSNVPKVVGLMHDYPLRKHYKVDGHWSLVLPLPSANFYQVRCPVCGMKSSLRDGLSQARCLGCGADLPRVDIEGPVCGVTTGSFLHLAVPYNSRVQFMRYMVKGFRFHSDRAPGRDFVVEVEYWPMEGLHDADLARVTEIPLEALDGRFYSLLADAKRVKYPDLFARFAFPGLFAFPVDLLNSHVSRLYQEGFIDIHTLTALQDAGILHLRDFLLWSKNDILRFIRAEGFIFDQLERGLHGFLSRMLAKE